MKIIRSINQMQEFALRAAASQKTIGFVPTMGALHQGHLSLIRQARKDNDLTVVSIFVNPAQFGPREDFKKYPRVFKRDAAFCKKEGVDVIFYPQAKAMYPDNYQAYVNVEDLSSPLCGKPRLGHFRGVATVVSKLFNIVRPNSAYFGQKDAQQSVIVKRLASDLNFPVKIKVMPIVREVDGLAMSSRNRYLNQKERRDALVLYKALRLAQHLIKSGLKDSSRIILRMRQLISKKRRAKIDYTAIVDAQTLEPIKKIKAGCLIALAVYIGKTRLIDNIVIELKSVNRNP